MRIIKYFLLLVVMSGLLSGCAFNNSEVIFTVNGHSVTKSDYNELYEQNLKNPMYQILMAGGPEMAAKIEPIIKEQTVNALIGKKLMEDEIKKRKITVSGKEFNEFYNRAIENMGGRKHYMEQLKKDGLSETQIKKKVREGLIQDKLFKEFSSEEDLNTYYLQLKDKAEIIYIDKSYDLTNIQKEIGWQQAPLNR